MRVPSALAATVLLLLSGCLSSGGADGDDGATDEGSALATGPTVFRGSVEFGENTTALTDVDPALRFGTTGFAYVSAYGPEPNIGVTSSGAVFTSAFSTVMRSTDGGLNWTAVHTHAIPLAADTVGDNNDPMLWVDQWTDTVYNAPMFPILLCASIYASADDGETWPAAPTPACGDAPFDHQKLASGPAGPDLNPLAAVGLHPTVLYLCYNGIAVTNCAVSYDGGTTWPVNRPTVVNTVGFVVPQEQPTLLSPCFSGQNGHPTVSYQGVVAMLRTWSCTQPMLTYSTDSGLTWTNVAGPGFPGGPSDFLNTANAHSIDPEVAFTPDGTMYVLFQSWDHRAYLARTTDLGASWEGPFDVTPPGTSSTVFAALGAGSDGRVAMAFVAAGNVTGSSAGAPDDTRWHLHIVTSEDAASEDPTFVAYQATPDADPVQVGPIHQGGGSANTRNLLDFIDGAVAPDGSFYVSFTDGCTPFNECAALPRAEQTTDFRGSAGAVAWLKGWSLLDEPRTGPLPL
ncbi:MAG: sialidase family protein [Candidatus Thermoplasmatota archaeon]